MLSFFLYGRWEGGTKDSWFSDGARKTHSLHWSWWSMIQFTTTVHKQDILRYNVHVGAWFSLWKRIWQSFLWINLRSFLFNIYKTRCASKFFDKTSFSTNSLLGIFAIKGLPCKVKWYTKASLDIAYQCKWVLTYFSSELICVHMQF